jgi:hypothetical protein
MRFVKSATGGIVTQSPNLGLHDTPENRLRKEKSPSTIPGVTGFRFSVD